MPTRPPRSLVDSALAGATFLVTLALVGRSDFFVSAAARLGPGDVVLAAAASLPLLLWRRFPLGVFAVTMVATTVHVAIGVALGVALGPAVALYLLVANRPWSRRSAQVVLGLYAAWLVATAITQGWVPANAWFHGTLFLAVAWFAGERTRLRREHIAALEERARRAEADAHRDQRLAVAEERARIARDLHDSAGHAINVIGVLAGAARLREDDDLERTRRTLETIEELARETVGDLDHMVGALRDRTPPGLASLQTLVAQHTSAGLDVSVHAAAAPRRLVGSVDQAAFRILQEALTNAARHGTGTASVTLDFRADAVALTVTNPVRSTGLGAGGHGLIGMRERATLAGGRLDAGAVDGMFRVHAELPL